MRPQVYQRGIQMSNNRPAACLQTVNTAVRTHVPCGVFQCGVIIHCTSGQSGASEGCTLTTHHLPHGPAAMDSLLSLTSHSDPQQHYLAQLIWHLYLLPQSHDIPLEPQLHTQPPIWTSAVSPWLRGAFYLFAYDQMLPVSSVSLRLIGAGKLSGNCLRFKLFYLNPLV